MKITIDELLALDFKYDDYPYLNTEEIEDFYIFSVLNINSYEGLKVRHYMNDECWDERARTIEVLEYNGVPFYLYQYIGRGYCRNCRVINKEVMEDFIKNTIIKAVGNFETSEPSSEFEIDTYGAELKLENNKLITYYDKTIK